MFKKDNFEKVIKFTLKWEGGYTIDSGGKTKYGISQKAYPNIDIKNITLEKAKLIYKKNYWKPLRCDHYDYPLALTIFDMGVNIGIRRTVKFIQLSCNEFLYEPIKVDGILGNKTLTAIKYCEKIHPLKFVILINNYRYKWYCKLVKKSKYSKYLLGWINRCNNLINKIIKYKIH